MAKSMPEEQRARMGEYFKGLKQSITEMHREIEIDPVFSNKDFAFTPPEEAELVESFRPPGFSRPEESRIVGNLAPDFALKDIAGN